METIFCPIEKCSCSGCQFIKFCFTCGFPTETIEVTDVKFINYNRLLTLKDLAIKEITYHSRDADTPMRADASEGINLHRKGPVNVVIYGDDGEPVNDTSLPSKW